MSLSRRDFLKWSGGASGGVLAGTRGIDLAPVEAAASDLRIKEAKAFPGVCPYCAVGCAQLIYVKDGKIIDIEGDPDTPHTEGALCPKGSSTYQLSINARRLDQGAVPRARQRPVGGEAARLDDGADRPAGEEDARRDLRGDGDARAAQGRRPAQARGHEPREAGDRRLAVSRAGQGTRRRQADHGQPLRGDRLARLLGARQRGELPHREARPRVSASSTSRTPRGSATRRRCRRSARPFGRGRDDDQPDRRRQRRRDHADLELGRVPPGQLPVGDEGQGARARRSSTSIRASRGRPRPPTYWVPIRSGTNIVFFGGLIRYAIESKQVLPRLRRRTTRTPPS